MSQSYAMSQHLYAYPAAPAPATRQYAVHGTSSAFSPSANPDEDWTKISDLAERRRIQNRIAQRNYRKKLKRRLEDLERRAGSTDGATGSEKPVTATKSNKRQSASKVQKTSPVPKPLVSQFTPPMATYDEPPYVSHYDSRERTQSPPIFAYSTYPPLDEMPLASYAPTQTYPTMTSAEAYPTYLAAAVPVTLPSMTHFSDALKHGDDGLSPYMNYSFIPGIDVSSANSYDHSNPHTPPLSHSFDHSANCSDAGYDYPTTPLSMPGSPGMIHH